jgi:hypothetical protein
VTSAGVAESIIIVTGVAAIALIGGVSALTFTKTFGAMFLGTPRVPLPPDVGEPSAVMRRPQYVLAALIALVALTPFLTFNTVVHVVSSSFYIRNPYPGISEFVATLQKVSLALVMFTALVLIVRVLRNIATAALPERKSDTWGCGSLHQSVRMQYTASSFTKPASKLFGSLLPFRRRYRRIAADDIFPKTAYYTYIYSDWVETMVFRPIGKLFKRISALSLHVQDGKLQWYILYGLLFILAVILLMWMKVI